MKIYFKSSVILILLLTGMSSISFGQAKQKANKDTEAWRYEIEGAGGVGSEGTYLIKVWSYSKKPKIAIEQAKKNAIHGVIFKGFAGAKGDPSQKPLASNPSIEDEKADFFNDFFADGGKYMKYVGVVGNGDINAGDVIKIGKEYKIGVIVSVQKDYLRKDLEAAGVIKGLSSGF